MDDIARFLLFIKLRSQIRGSDNHLIVGIDIAKDKHHAFFGTPKGQSLWRRLIFTNDLSGFNRLTCAYLVLYKRLSLPKLTMRGV
ncbi:hypothetical protein [Desulfosarcina variabilis]|uniref:hypothetical protein n=1 Tax=Desulfosarcina variabilis TaxID=2300 RepID=UPI003AFB187F